MTRFTKYEGLVAEAKDETKAGGDPSKGLVFAILALAEIIRATEKD